MKELGDKKKNRKKRQRKSKNAAGSYFIWKKRTSPMIKYMMNPCAILSNRSSIVVSILSIIIFPCSKNI